MNEDKKTKKLPKWIKIVFYKLLIYAFFYVLFIY